MNKVHFILQAKGGIGKSYVASLLAQQLSTITSNLLVMDIDQENPTLSQYQALKAERLSVVGEGRAIDPKLFDKLMIRIIEHDGDVVVDTGANTFSALLSYAIENSAFDILQENGKELILHTIVGGGDTMYDTANGFADLANYVDGNIVLWLNEHFGKLVTSTGITIENSKVFKENYDKLIGVVTLKERTKSTFGVDINKMNAARMTFEEVMLSDEFDLMEKSRLQIVRKSIFEQLESIETV